MHGYMANQVLVAHLDNVCIAAAAIALLAVFFSDEGGRFILELVDSSGARVALGWLEQVVAYDDDAAVVHLIQGALDVLKLLIEEKDRAVAHEELADRCAF